MKTQNSTTRGPYHLLIGRALLIMSLLALAACGDEDSGEGVGGFCGGGSERSCSAELFCDQSGDCGEDGSSGVCSEVPEVCAEIYSPVCGCDGKTYGNSCQASSQKVSIRYQGEC